MLPLSDSNSHSNLLARRLPLVEDRVIFIRFIFAFIHSHRACPAPSLFQIPLRPKVTSGRFQGASKERSDEEPEVEPTENQEQELEEESSVGELEERSEEEPEDEFEEELDAELKEELEEDVEEDLEEDLEEGDEEAGEHDLEEEEEEEEETESEDDPEEIFEDVFGDLFSGTSPQTPPSSPPPPAEKCPSPSSATEEREEEEDEEAEAEEVLQQFHYKDEYPDFTILCENHRYLVHKHILEVNSPYFERMFRFNGKEATNKQATLHSIDPTLIAHILSFMYNSSYTLPGGTLIPPDDYCNHATAALLTGPPKAAAIFKRKCPCRGKTLSATHLLPHISIYALADYFSMPALKEYACKATRDVLHVCWNDSEEELALAEALEEAFAGTPDEDRGVQDALVETLKEHPGLWVDEGVVAEWLDGHEEVRDEVDPPFEDGWVQMKYSGGEIFS